MRGPEGIEVARHLVPIKAGDAVRQAGAQGGVHFAPFALSRSSSFVFFSAPQR